MGETSAVYNYKVGDDFFRMIEATGIEKGDLDVSVTVKKETRTFKLDFYIQGYVVGICDRCLDEIKVDVETENVLYVKFGEKFSDDEEIVVVPETEGKVNVAWYIYEFAYLSLPYRMVHEEGECNEQMQEKLKCFIRHEDWSEDEDELNAEVTEDDESVCVRETDPRWSALREILKDNDNTGK